MATFLHVLMIVTAVAHLPFVLAVGELASRVHAPFPWAIGVGLGVSGFGLFLARARAGMTDRRRPGRALLGVDIVFFVHFCACLFTILPSLLATLSAPLLDLSRGRSLRLPMDFYLWCYATGLLFSGYGVLWRRRWFMVKRIEVPIPGLDRRLDGFTIAHLSDLHIGTLTPRSWGERWVRAANRRAPDIAVVTGDMVTSGTDFHEDIADVVGSLAARQGVFVSMGNHDYFGEGEPLISLLRARGACVLRNEGRVLEKNGARLFLAGIDDTWTRRDDMARALAHRPQGMAAVLLAHDPQRFPQAAKYKVDLTLSGHTHGGQIAVPFLYRWLSLSHLTHRFHVGIYRDGGSVLYVHPGLGTTGPPIRLGVAPAVVILELRSS